jgi:hypothetical protein
MTEPTEDTVQFCILQECISAEHLKNLSIRIVSELDFEIEGDTIKTFIITKTGLTKLSRAGYTVEGAVDSGKENIKFVPLTNPDGTPAKAGQDPSKMYTTKIVSWDGNTATSFKESVIATFKKHLGPIVGRNIEICVPHNRTNQPNKNEKVFKVHIWSSPDPGSMEIPTSIFGLSGHDCSSCGFSIWVDGNPVIAPEGELGAYDELNLYIYWDAVHNGRPNEIAVIDKFLEETVKLMQLPIDDAGRREQIKAQYVDICSKKITARLRDMDTEYKQYDVEVAEAQKVIVDRLRDMRRLQAELSSVDAYTKNMKAQLAKEFDNLFKISHVKNVKFRGNKLTVSTDIICCVHPKTNKEHEVGAFDIVVDTITSQLLFFNKTRRVDAFKPAMNGPHLFPDGTPCLGSMKEIIPRLVASYEWSAAIQMAIAFVESVNLDDAAGAYIDRWPLSPAQIAADKEAKERKSTVEAVTAREPAATAR